MFITVTDQMDIYDNASFNSTVVGKIGINQAVNVTGNVVAAEGWIWHEVAGGGLWIIERSLDGAENLVFMRWQGEGNPPRPEGVTVGLQDPEPPSLKPTGQFQIDGIQFTLNGTPFRFVGVNVREIAYYGYRAWGPAFHGANNEGHITLQLDVAKQMYAQVFRLYAPYHKDLDGNRTKIEDAVTRIKNVLDEAEKRNMFALISLDDAKQSGFNVGVLDHAKYREPDNRYNMDYYKEGYKETYIPFVEALLNPKHGIAGHNALFAWGVCNEAQVSPYTPFQALPDDVVPTFLEYFKHSSEVIRSLDSKTMITTGIEAAHNVFVEHAYENSWTVDKLYGDIETIDFATVHSYQTNENPDHYLGHNHDKGLKELRRAKSTWQKPVVVEEMGPTGGPNRHGGGWVNQAVKGWFDAGAAGCMQWGFSAADGDIGVGDDDAGMHNISQHTDRLPYRDWGDMFNTYQSWGRQFWVGRY